MTIQLLGTGAADGIPSFYGDDPVSLHAREFGGKDRRTRSSALIGDDLKIDLGPDNHAQCVANNVDPSKWTALIFTHSHEDHVAASELQYGLIPFNEREYLPFTIFANDEVTRQIEEMYPDWPIEVVTTRSFQPFVHGEYLVTPIRANHKNDEDSQNLVIQQGSKTLLYGTDTGIWGEDTWEYLKRFQLDALILECTEAFSSTDYWGHLSFQECLDVVARLRDQGGVSTGTQIITTHHSHQGNATHAQLENALAPHGIVPGFDGLKISF
jgi:phosphoribosyl 1,2-cyclic phosphate phosphodiesterase